MRNMTFLSSRGVSCSVDVLQFRIMRRIYKIGINLLRFSLIWHWNDIIKPQSGRGPSVYLNNYTLLIDSYSNLCMLTPHIQWIVVPACNLLWNIYNKAYRSILGFIMMSNDGRICFIVVPDKNIMVCCSKYNFSDFMTAILNCMF